MGPYLLSHHPHCAAFAADVFLAKGRRYCISCFIGLPILLASWAAFWWAATTRPAPWPVAHIVMAAVGLLLFLPQVASHFGAFRSRRAQIVVKVAMGLGIGAVAAAVCAAPWPGWRRLLVLGVGYLLLLLVWLLRFRRLDRTCDTCMDRPNRPYCVGLIELQTRMHPPDARQPPSAQEALHSPEAAHSLEPSPQPSDAAERR